MTRRSPTLSLSCSVTRIAVPSCESAGLVQMLVALENPTPRVTRDVTLPTGQIDHLLPLKLLARALDHRALRLHQLEESKGHGARAHYWSSVGSSPLSFLPRSR